MFKLILISQPNFFVGEKEILISLFENDLHYFHLRKPERTKNELAAFIESIPKIYHNRIIVHSHYSLVNDFTLKGIHCKAIGRDEFYNYEHLKIQKSISTHGFCEAGSVEQLFDYAFLSPIFDSISKSGYNQAYQHDAVCQFLTRPNKTDFIALGGITEKNILLCKEMGFKGVALLGYIWGNQNPLEQWKTILQIAQNL